MRLQMVNYSNFLIHMEYGFLDGIRRGGKRRRREPICRSPVLPALIYQTSEWIRSSKKTTQQKAARKDAGLLNPSTGKGKLREKGNFNAPLDV